MKRKEQNILLNDLVSQVAEATFLLKNTRDKMLKDDIFDKRSFEHLMSASDIGTHYLYLLYMIRALNNENREEYFNERCEVFVDITRFCAKVTSMRKVESSPNLFLH